jgi:hypothetical protein
MGGLRNVQSTHSFFPQAGPAAPPPQQDVRPHSWDNSGAQLSNMAAAQSHLLQQLNPQLLATLSSQAHTAPFCPADTFLQTCRLVIVRLIFYPVGQVSMGLPGLLST